MQFRTAVATAIVLALVLSLPASVLAAGPLLFDKAEYAARRASSSRRSPTAWSSFSGRLRRPATANSSRTTT